ncbi:MAG TPA: leucyl/phenylalanyl-tRNA--protein transferase [Phycisphaerae bacterium]|nr:leucyl/phenylalanyl-tRNA--protein transferase [Phycisphaerae bacterium]
MNPQLAPELLLAAYSRGIFPMAEEEGRIMWFCPDPRAIIELDALRVSKTLAQLYRQGRFELTVNRDFIAIITACADRPEGTWISQDFIEAYGRLHELGYAHSIEAWRQGELAGGLYGVAIGGVFCGESMFFRQRDASKIALVYLVERMNERGFELLDVQFTTDHLARMGAVEIPREEYFRRLAAAVRKPCRFAD